MVLRYIIYFMIGGTVISSVTYLASHSRGLLAAFIANMPVITLVTFLTIYGNVGQAGVVPYAEGLLIMLFPWLTYILTIIFLTQRLGFTASLITGLILYFAIAFVILKKF